MNENTHVVYNMVWLNMFGAEVEVMPNTMIRIMPYDDDSDEEEDYDMDEQWTTKHEIEVVVESIHFWVTRAMLVQKDDPSLANNFFAMHLRHQETNSIHIPCASDVPNVIAKAMYYPFIFDFLRRRLVDSSAPLHIHSLDDEHMKQLNILEDYLLADFVHAHYLPVGPLYPNTRCIVTPPPQIVHDLSGKFIGRRQEYYPLAMCVDPALVRLVLSFYEFDSETYQYRKRQEPPTQAIWQQAAFIMKKYEMDFNDILHCKIHPDFVSGQSITFTRKYENNAWHIQVHPAAISNFVV